MTRLPALPLLAPGDVVDVVAPASATSMTRVEAGCEVLRGFGLVPRLPARLFGRVVWAARGGYGCTRLLPRLARARRPRVPKLVAGFSDITALQGFLADAWGWPSLHAPNVAHLADGGLPRSHLLELRRHHHRCERRMASGLGVVLREQEVVCNSCNSVATARCALSTPRRVATARSAAPCAVAT